MKKASRSIATCTLSGIGDVCAISKIIYPKILGGHRVFKCYVEIATL